MRRFLASLALAFLCSLVTTAAVAQTDAYGRPTYQDRGYYDRQYSPPPYQYAPQYVPQPQYAPERFQQSQRYGGGGLRIMEAWYGRNRRVCDAAPALRGACDGRESCAVKAGNELCGDPTPGRVKQLTVTFSCHGQVRTTDRPEPGILGLRC